MSLKTTPVAKCLDKQLLFLGFEVPDVIAVFLTLSILNFIFGQTQLKLLLVWAPTAALAIVLYFGKKGKPEKYLVHWLRFQFLPGVYPAFPEPSEWSLPPRTKRGAE